MSFLKKAAIGLGVILLLAAGCFGLWYLRVSKSRRLQAEAGALLEAAIKDKDPGRAKQALAAFQAVIERDPNDWYPNYADLFSAARIAGDFAPAEAAFARMTEHRQARIAKTRAFQDVRWHRAAAYYGFTRFELLMVPRDKAIYEGDERTMLPAAKAALEAYDLARTIREWREGDLAGVTEPAKLLQGIASDEKNVEENVRIAEQMREHVAQWTASPELARGHAVYLQGVNLYEKKDPAAKERLLQALQLDPRHVQAAAVLSFVEFDAGREPEAARSAAAAIALFTAPGRPALDERDRQALADVRGILAATLYHESLAKAKSRSRTDRAAAAELLAQAKAELSRGLADSPKSGQCLRLQDELAAASR
ncbi:MAG: hypothetical protein HY924_08840 [Elusimicrobia bacterium]|nr:hypothetical protein [Elusimicrobiota bacterium]